jgi:hypothetical protein
MRKIMRKKIFIVSIVVLCLVLLIALFSNPSPAFHKADLKNRVYKELNIDTLQQEKPDNLFDYITNFTNNIGKSMVDKTVENTVQVDDYYFFSLTKVTYQGQTKVIGMGAFNQLFLFVNLKEVINEQIIH